MMLLETLIVIIVVLFVCYKLFNVFLKPAKGRASGSSGLGRARGAVEDMNKRNMDLEKQIKGQLNR